uniref:Putative secreted protein n=1 Tax=Amblyomma triste TaxID=251400 RepID=A0A023G3Z6_AMBTT
MNTMIHGKVLIFCLLGLHIFVPSATASTHCPKEPSNKDECGGKLCGVRNNCPEGCSCDSGAHWCMSYCKRT